MNCSRSALPVSAGPWCWEKTHHQPGIKTQTLNRPLNRGSSTHPPPWPPDELKPRNPDHCPPRTGQAKRVAPSANRSCAGKGKPRRSSPNGTRSSGSVVLVQ